MYCFFNVTLFVIFYSTLLCLCLLCTRCYSVYENCVPNVSLCISTVYPMLLCVWVLCTQCYSVNVYCVPNVSLCVSIVYPWFVYCNFLVLLRTTVCSQNINKLIVNLADEIPTDYILNPRIIWKDDIEFVTEFPCLLVHPVV